MNKQRKVLITTTYNEMGIIIDTKAEEVAQPNLQPTCNQLATDCISREAAIDAMAKALWYYPNACYRNLNEYEVAKGLAELGLKSVPPAQPEPQWIPCSERMPEKNGIYFVSYEDADTWLLEWFNGKWFVYPSNPAREETETITAWMPLPEPYAERREE